jgi:hypothetical protein
MLEVMEKIVASHPDLYVAARMPTDDNLRDAVRRYRADVVILMQPDGDRPESSADRTFRCRPSKVLAIAEGGGKGVLLVPRPHVTVLPELSANSLVEAIRLAGDA